MTELTYRYTLRRAWSMTGGIVCWVMLNPSTADESTDDPTIRRVMRFSKDLGFSQLEVVNLYALRATDPKVLGSVPRHEAIGPRNDAAIHIAVGLADAVVFAWGASNPHPQRATDVIRIVQYHATRAWCLGTTKAGHPRHPLYVPAAQGFLPWATVNP